MQNITTQESSSRIRETPSRSRSSASAATPAVPNKLAAQQVGISRNNSLQQHIDRMAMPRFGYGFGVGGFGGFW